MAVWQQPFLTCSCVRPLYLIPPSLGGRMIAQPERQTHCEVEQKKTWPSVQLLSVSVFCLSISYNAALLINTDAATLV